MIPVIVIEGPTASGKTALALELAQRFDTEIISADSRQVYKYLDIGTAKPTKAELSLIKHHLIDIINPNESFNAGLFRNKAMEIIKDLHTKGKIPIICGGTGLYIKALLEGLFEVEIDALEIRKELEAELPEKGLAALYKELSQIDPVAAQSISCNDKQRTLRAIEVYRATGIPISEHWKNQSSTQELLPYRILLEDDREALYQRINERITKMLVNGLLDEIKSTLNLGYSWSDPGFDSVGYKEFKPYYDNELGIDECTAIAQQHSRNYAKRQITWYRKCTFNLTGHYSSVILTVAEEKIKTYFLQ